jgi:hypothetical protein
MASYARHTSVYGTGTNRSKKSNYNRDVDPYSPQKVNQFTEEFDELIKNRHLGREGVTHFEAPKDKRRRELHEEMIKDYNSKCWNLECNFLRLWRSVRAYPSLFFDNIFGLLNLSFEVDFKLIWPQYWQ